MAIECSNGKPWIDQYAFNSSQSGDLGGWTLWYNTPPTTQFGSIVGTNGYVYLIAGVSPGTWLTPAPQRASIDASGVIGTWAATTPSLPGDLWDTQAVITYNRVYLIGGVVPIGGGQSAPYSTVLTAPIAANGVIGTWVDSGSDLIGTYPGRAYGQAVVTKNRIYYIGGKDNDVPANTVATVLTAPIDASGVIGTWTDSGNDTPGVTYMAQSFVTKDRIYVVGGYVNDVAVDTVYTAPIDASGVIGTWTTASSLPVPIYLFKAIVTQNTVYLIDRGNATNSIYYAPIDSAGVIGTWVTGTSQIAASSEHLIVTSDKLYELGLSSGWDGYTAAFSGGVDNYLKYTYEAQEMYGDINAPIIEVESESINTIVCVGDIAPLVTIESLAINSVFCDVDFTSLLSKIDSVCLNTIICDIDFNMPLSNLSSELVNNIGKIVAPKIEINSIGINEILIVGSYKVLPEINSAVENAITCDGRFQARKSVLYVKMGERINIEVPHTVLSSTGDNPIVALVNFRSKRAEISSYGYRWPECSVEVNSSLTKISSFGQVSKVLHVALKVSPKLSSIASQEIQIITDINVPLLRLKSCCDNPITYSIIKYKKDRFCTL